MDLNKLKVVPVSTKNVIASRLEDGSLPGLGPSLEIPKPKALVELEDQVYETLLCKDIRN